MEPKLASLEERLELSAGELKKVVLGAPALLGYSWQDNMEPTLRSLKEFLQLSPAELKKVVLGRPPLLGCSWQDNMEPMLRSLKEELHLSPAELKELVIRAPILLGRRWDSNIGPQIAMMEDAVGPAGPATEVKDLILSNPGVLLAGNETRVRPRLAELKAVSQGVDRSMLSAVCNYTDVRWKKRMEDIG